jgi:hypothetical protein
LIADNQYISALSMAADESGWGNIFLGEIVAERERGATVPQVELKPIN